MRAPIGTVCLVDVSQAGHGRTQLTTRTIRRVGQVSVAPDITVALQDRFFRDLPEMGASSSCCQFQGTPAVVLPAPPATTEHGRTLALLPHQAGMEMPAGEVAVQGNKLETTPPMKFPPGAALWGTPALPYILEQKLFVLRKKLSELFKRVDALEQNGGSS